MHSPLVRPRPAAALFHREHTASRSSRGHSCPMAAADSSNGASANGSGKGQRPFTELGRMTREMKRKEENPFPRQRLDGHSGGLKNQVQLSAYGHHIGDNLKDLEAFMDKHLKGAISGLHLLPVYPSTGDGGFAPTTYKEIDPDMGTWSDVERIAEKYDLMLEFMVNHISPGSAEFRDFKEHGAKSKFADMFVDWERIWGKGDPSPDQLAMIRTRKPEAPVIDVKCDDGSLHRLWCTFGEQQIDIDPFSASGKVFVSESLRALGTHGAKLVRLDAFGYATKKADTRCFFEEPETWELLEGVCEDCKDHNTQILCEVHEEYETNIRLAERGYWVYDFALPLLVLHAFTFKTAKNLRHWLTICPRRQITVLDTHDGLGIDDIAGLTDVADVEQLQLVVTESLGCNPNFKYFYHEDDHSYHGRPHQYNCTYFSAVERNSRTYLLARVIQFFTPGIPMIYYVGLLAGANDFDAVEEQGPRGINSTVTVKQKTKCCRHRYSVKEAEEALQQPVVKALLQLCRFRNTHEAFMGDVEVADVHEDELLEVTWRNGAHRATLHANLKDFSFYCEATEPQGAKMRTIKWMLGTEDCSEGCVPGEPPVKWESEEMCSPSAV